MGAARNRAFLLTPAGAGAIGVVRVSGPDANAIVGGLFFRANRASTGARNLGPAENGSVLRPGDRVRYGYLVDAGEVIDDVLVSEVSGPGDPSIDICCHGGVRVMERILGAVEKHGATVSQLPGPVDPIWPTETCMEAEAFDALAACKTTRAVRFVTWQRRELVRVLRQAAEVCLTDPGRARRTLEALTTGVGAARTLIHGTSVVLVGPRNSGKSTLFNRLVGRSCAVVSPRPGTTRDWVSQPIEIHGVPITLVDTAGRGLTSDWLEREAIAAGEVVARQAELRVLVLDGSQALSDRTRKLLQTFQDSDRRLAVINKYDLGAAWGDEALPRGLCQASFRASALEGSGLDQITGRTVDLLGCGAALDRTATLFTPRLAKAVKRMLSDFPLDRSEARSLILDVVGSRTSRPGPAGSR